MADEPEFTIKGLQEAQAAMEAEIAALKPGGSFGRAVKEGTIIAFRYAVSITHVITGSLRASHRMKIEERSGRISLDPGAINPVTGNRPAEYGVTEHARGGSHAFYARTVEEAGPRVAREVEVTYRRGVGR